MLLKKILMKQKMAVRFMQFTLKVFRVIFRMSRKQMFCELFSLKLDRCILPGPKSLGDWKSELTAVHNSFGSYAF